MKLWSDVFLGNMHCCAQSFHFDLIILRWPTISMSMRRGPTLVELVRVEVRGGVVGRRVVQGARRVVQVAGGGGGHHAQGPMKT